MNFLLQVVTLPLRLAQAGADTVLGLIADRRETAARPSETPFDDPLHTPSPPPEPPPPPPHLDTESERVVTSADPGAPAEVGAEIEIAEPWDGYDSMPVAQVARQLSAAPAATAAAVRLYESSNRNRTGVLRAADRRLAG